MSLDLIINQLAKVVSDSVGISSSLIKTQDFDTIDIETKKQKLELKVAYEQAKVAQEIAIAQRIENAKEVVLEEYYEAEQKGNLGITNNEQGLAIGASGEGRVITKRVYRFIGNYTINDNTTIKDIEINETK